MRRPGHKPGRKGADMILVVHDNGIRGQQGWSEEPGTDQDVDNVKAEYADAGITIYSITVIA
jgi:hypothetical protein